MLYSCCKHSYKRMTTKENEDTHWGVTCDASGMAPIVGKRFTKRGENYDLCEAEFDKLGAEEQALFACVERRPPTTKNIRSAHLECRSSSRQHTLLAHGSSWTLSSNARGVHLESPGAHSVLPFLPPWSLPSPEPELVMCLRAIAAACDDMGRWCAAHRQNRRFWPQQDLLQQHGLRLLELVGTAPAAAQRHLVQTTVRVAQVARAFKGHDRYNAAMGQLDTLHGKQGQGAAKVAAAAECVRLGVEMDAAWLGFPEAEREALRALPWENDGEAAVVGVWDVRQPQQQGDDILRPPLRQPVPELLEVDDVQGQGPWKGTYTTQNMNQGLRGHAPDYSGMMCVARAAFATLPWCCVGGAYLILCPHPPTRPRASFWAVTRTIS